MSKKKYLIQMLFVLLLFFVSSNTIYADKISPFINKVSLKTNERTWEYIKYTNEGDTKKEILLLVYGYNMQKEKVDETIPTLLRVDTDTFTINPGESKDLPYEIVLPDNIAEGTYFNLLILQPSADNASSSVTSSSSVSQVVRIDIYPENSTDNKISVTPSSISLETINRGIPWIKASEIKYTYTNTSNYILQPKGEIQIFNEKQNTEPVYLKINKEEKLLYPGETLTETLKINKWNIYDLIYNKVVLGRFYNGVDGEYQGAQTTIEGFKDEVLIAGVAILFLFIMFGESSRGKGRKIPEEYEDEGDEEE
mgnify:CR=1 FL=1